MLRPNGQLVIVDYGAARSMAHSDDPVAPSADHATTIGTPDFMCAEQRDGLLQYNFDLYSLGWTLIMLLTREMPLNWRSYHRNEDGTSALSWYETLCQALLEAQAEGQSGLTESVYQRSLRYLTWLQRFVGTPEQRPTDATVVWSEIQAVTKQNALQDALTAYRQIIQTHWRRWAMVGGGVALAVVSLWGTSQWWASQLIQESITLRRQEKHLPAAEKLATALFLSPHNPEALNIMGMNYEDLGNRAEALKLFQQSVRVNPNYVWGYSNLARRYLLDNNLTEADKQIHAGMALVGQLPPSEEKSEIHSFLTKNLVWLLISRQEPDRALPLLEKELRTKEMIRWQPYAIDKCFEADIFEQKRSLSLDQRMELWRNCNDIVKDWLKKEPRNEEPQKWAERLNRKTRPFARGQRQSD